MTHPLDEFPLDWSEPVMQDVQASLASVYRRSKDIEAISDEVGIDPAEVDLDGSAKQIWRSVMREASRTIKLRLLLTVFKAKNPQLAIVVDEWLGPAPPVTPPAEHGDAGGEPDWKGFSADSGAERQIVQGHDTLLDIVFLARGLERARSVCYLRVEAGGKRYVGTGFRIGPDLILTNHHVVLVEDKDGITHPATSILAWFDYEATDDGGLKNVVKVRCDAATVVTDGARDWAVLHAVDAIPDRFPALSVDAPVTLVPDDRVYIIQHPNGRPKMIGMLHNIVRSIDDDVIQYWTDTEEGSSGSPVFDEQWRVVGLHHRWVEQVVDGRSEFRNQGQRIDRVVRAIEAAGVTVGV